jgi:hypothetical protein
MTNAKIFAKLPRVITIVRILIACCLSFQTAAAAEGKVYRYCLESGDNGGGSTVTCYYETLEQCMASKGAPGDTCYANPQRGGR